MPMGSRSTDAQTLPSTSRTRAARRPHHRSSAVAPSQHKDLVHSCCESFVQWARSLHQVRDRSCTFRSLRFQALRHVGVERFKAQTFSIFTSSLGGQEISVLDHLPPLELTQDLLVASRRSSINGALVYSRSKINICALRALHSQALCRVGVE